MGIAASLAGRVEVRLRGDEGVAVTGFGPFFRRRVFDVREVKSVRTGPTKWQQNGKSRDLIIIELRNGDAIRFGSQLSDARCAWMAAALRMLLIGK